MTPPLAAYPRLAAFVKMMCEELEIKARSVDVLALGPEVLAGAEKELEQLHESDWDLLYLDSELLDAKLTKINGGFGKSKVLDLVDALDKGEEA